MAARSKGTPVAKSAGTALAEAEKAAVLENALEGMMEGKTLQEVCKGMAMPPSTVRRWLVTDEAWRHRYATARLAQGQAMAEEAIQVARESTNHSSAADRLLIETLKWAASKANPAEYGDRQTVEHQGAQTLQIRVLESDGRNEPTPVVSQNVSPSVAKGVAMLAASTPVLPILPGQNPLIDTE
jgi:hypothetical protein